MSDIFFGIAWYYGDDDFIIRTLEYSLSMWELINTSPQHWSLFSRYFRYASNINYISITMVQSYTRKYPEFVCHLYCYSCCTLVTIQTANKLIYMLMLYRVLETQNRAL